MFTNEPYYLFTTTLQGNVAFRRGEFNTAVKHYEAAHEIEPELPYYQLNLAAAYLKLNKYVLSRSKLLPAMLTDAANKAGWKLRRHVQKH